MKETLSKVLGFDTIDAILSLIPEAEVTVSTTANPEDGETITWVKPLEAEAPTIAEIDAELTRMKAEYATLKYARNRKLEYPTVDELTVAMYDTDDKAALATKRAAVKTKWPKDNSGPV